ncbi:MAG: hypothetical protein QOF98_259 [Streptomyces sp.]|nr:hypothetical protein [Streptomyces sp.]
MPPAIELKPALATALKFHRPELVPYITAWSSERPPRSLVVATEKGIGYADEGPYDRDVDGVLWTRCAWGPGKGRPEFGKVHALRQRRAMRKLLCQVCGRPADRTADGLLWLITEDPGNPGSWPNPLTTTHPPVCLTCAKRAVRACPYLGSEYVAVRASEFAPAGVHGALYRPGAPKPVVTQIGGVEYSDPRIHWLRAGQLIVRLDRFTVVDLEAECSAAGDASGLGGRMTDPSPADDAAMDAYLDAIDRGLTQRRGGGAA